jgi:catalase
MDAAHERFGVHPGCRALHAKGTLLKGTFRATPAGKRLSRAAHLQGDPIPVTARVSNAGGDPGEPDYAPDFRGLALKLYLPSGKRTDIVAQTSPRFPASEPEGFHDLLRSSKPSSAAWRTPLFLARHPGVALELPRTTPVLIQPPQSYATQRYFAIHAFKWLDADGNVKWVRYTLEPEAGVHTLSPLTARRRGRDYLREEILERVAREPVRFRLILQLAESGDDPNDARAVWPKTRERVDAGTFVLDAPETEREQDGDILVFDPTRIVDGIELSDDPVLRFRHAAYAASVKLRSGAERPDELA